MSGENLAWTIEFSDDAKRDLRKLDKSIQRQIYRYLSARVACADDPTEFGKGLKHELNGLWRYRVGDYRILCRIEEEALIVLVVEVGHRSTVYD